MSVMNITPTGERFQAPMAMTEVSPLAHTKERYLWAVLDQTALEDAMEHAKGRTPDAVGVDMDRLYNNFQFEIDQEVEWGSIKKAATLEGLAEKLGVDPKVLLASVAEHNAHLHDPMPFGPPPGGDGDDGPGGPPPKPGNEDEDEDEGGMFGPMDMPDPTPLQTAPSMRCLSSCSTKMLSAVCPHTPICGYSVRRSHPRPLRRPVTTSVASCSPARSVSPISRAFCPH